MNCPTHNAPMQTTATRFGRRWDCTVEGCTVASWSGDTAIPADAETRALRKECHELFDPLWKRKTLFTCRGAAYKWLRLAMGLDHAPHIGQFDRQQCRNLLAILKPRTDQDYDERHGFWPSIRYDQKHGV